MRQLDGSVMSDGYGALRAEYIAARDDANTARQAWSAFLAVAPVDDVSVPPMLGNITLAYNDLAEAEKREKAALDALYAIIRPSL
jgi:hypothetical protein